MIATAANLAVTAGAQPVPDAAADDTLQTSLRRAARLAASAAPFAAQFDFGDLDLPPTTGSVEDQARLRAVAPLYLASELESARLLPAVEMLAGVWVSGGLASDLGATGSRLTTFYRSRDDRLTPDERVALFARMFGTTGGPALSTENARNVAFEPLLIELAAALSDARSRDYVGASLLDVARIRIAAEQLTANLVSRAVGVAAFAAQEVVVSLSTALEMLRDQAVQQAVGARSVWGAVAAISRRWLQNDADIASHVTRARSGLVLLDWIAESLPHLGTDAAGDAAPSDAVTIHAIQWMQATLVLHDRAGAPAPGTRSARV